MTKGIKPLVAGNWKMNGVTELLHELRQMKAGFMSGLDAECDGDVLRKHRGVTC